MKGLETIELPTLPGHLRLHHDSEYADPDEGLASGEVTPGETTACPSRASPEPMFDGKDEGMGSQALAPVDGGFGAWSYVRPN